MTLKLDSLVIRLFAFFAMLAICALLFRVSLAHFVVRAVADPRVSLPREWLQIAAAKYPDSARVNFRLAESEMAESADPAQALAHASRAVELSPWDYQSRRLLAVAQELNGQQAEAEQSIFAAVRLAPNHAELNWTQANVLLRSGKLDTSVEYFRIAAVTRKDLLADAFELLWKGSDGKVEILKRLTASNPEMQLSLVQFLTGQGQAQDAVAIFNTIDRQARLESPRSAEFIQSLSDSGQAQVARFLWLDLASALSRTTPDPSSLVWNGSFESDLLRPFDQFDWQIYPNQYARIGIDRSETRSGLRSLRILFSGLDTTMIRDQVKQRTALRPGARYRLECFAKTTDLVTPEGPRLAILGGNSVIASSAPVAEGTSDWRQLRVEFTATAGDTPTFISIIRIPKFSYDDPTKGTVWFDDFTLSELDKGK